MSLIYADSFDTYSVLTQRYDTVNYGISTPVIATAAARNGPHGLYINDAVYSYSPSVRKNFTARATYVIGCAFQALTGFTDTCGIVSLWDGGTNQVELRMNSTGNFQFFRNGTALGSQTAFALSFNSWNFLECYITISSTGGVCSLHVNCLPVISLTGQNTQASVNASASGVAWGAAFPIDSPANLKAYYDDMYVLDPTVGSYNTTFLGDIRVSAQVPSANGSTNNYAQTGASFAGSNVMAVGQQLIDSNGNLQRVSAITSDAKTGASAPAWATTPLGGATVSNHVTFSLIQVAPLSNYNFVNEVPPDTSGLTYLSDGTVSDEDLYSFPPLTGATVFGVQVDLRACKDNSGARSIRALAESGGTTVDNGTGFPLSENVYADYQGIFETDPNTSSPWTIAGVNAAQYGSKTSV